MKKINIIIMPLITISFLASCGQASHPTHSITFNGAHLLLEDANGNYIYDQKYEEGTPLKLFIKPGDKYLLPKKEDVIITDNTGKAYDPSLYIYNEELGELMVTINEDIIISASTYNPYFDDPYELYDIFSKLLDEETYYTAHFVDGYNLPLYDIQFAENITHFKGYNEYDNGFLFSEYEFQSTLEVYLEKKYEYGTTTYYQYYPHGQYPVGVTPEAALPYLGRGHLDNVWHKEEMDEAEYDSMNMLMRNNINSIIDIIGFVAQSFPITTFVDDHYVFDFSGYGLFDIKGSLYIRDKKISKIVFNASDYIPPIPLARDFETLTVNVSFTYNDPIPQLPKATKTINYEVDEAQWNNATESILNNGPVAIDAILAMSSLSANLDAITQIHIGSDKHYFNMSNTIPGDASDSTFRQAMFLEYDGDQFRDDYYYQGMYSAQSLKQGIKCLERTMYSEDEFEFMTEQIESTLFIMGEFLFDEMDSFDLIINPEVGPVYNCDELIIDNPLQSGMTMTFQDVAVQFVDGHITFIAFIFNIYDMHMNVFATFSYKDVKVVPPYQAL